MPSRFGFVLGLHLQDSVTLYVLPEDQVLGEDVGGGQRYITEAKFQVYRGRNSAYDTEPLSRRLPQQNAYLHLMREGMATDSLNSAASISGRRPGRYSIAVILATTGNCR